MAALFSGKDPTRLTLAAYASRGVARILCCRVQKLEIQGLMHRSRTLSINVETFGTGAIPDDEIDELDREKFDLRPGAIIRDLDLRRPIYRQIAAYGHFGRDDLDLPWERTNKADELRAAAELKLAAAAD